MSDWLHEVLQMNRQQGGNTCHIVYGHISSYNKKKNAVKVLVPKLTDADGNMTESEWIQLATPMVGDGCGFQYHPEASATPDDLSKGEQVSILIFQRTTGLWAVAGMHFNDTMNPPGAGSDDGSTEDPNDPNGTNAIQPKEAILKLASGSFLKFYQNGDFQLYSDNDLKIRTNQDLTVEVLEGDLSVTVDKGNADVTVTAGGASISALKDVTVEAGGDVALTAGGTASIEATADVTVTAAGNATITAAVVTLGDGAQQQLLNLAAMELLNNHIHPAPGGYTGTPTIPMVPGEHTTANTTAS